MKIVCLNCKSAYVLVALKGNKDGVDRDARKVTTRCVVCCDVLAYTLHDVPGDEKARDRLQVIMMDDHLYPRSSLCARGQQDPEKMLMCLECPVAGALSREYCDLAKKRFSLLIKSYQEDEVDDDDGDDEPVSMHATSNDDFYIPEDDDE